MHKKVFISYANEDILYANRLYDFLAANDYDVWLDKRKLLAGANWEFNIQKALKEADFIIILLSSISVNKRGYVQREFKQSLKYAEEKLEGDIFIIPVLIDECIVPYGLDKFQWIRYLERDAFKVILSSLDSQSESFKPVGHYPKEVIHSKDLEVKFPFENNINTKITIPSFSDNPFFDASVINSSVMAEAFIAISAFQNFMISENHYVNMPSDRKSMVSLNIDYLMNYQSELAMSLALNIEEEFAGPHPVTRIKTKNFLFNPTRSICLRDLIETGNFNNFLQEAVGKYRISEDSWVLEMVNSSVKSGLENYYINEAEIDFLFDSDGLTLILSNHLPRVIQYGSNIRIPMNDLKLKIKI